MIKPTSRPTLADVARLAGVSAKTVSRVFAEPETVSPKTQAKVMDAAERLHFKPNTLARDLRMGAVTRMLGYVTSELTNPFYIQVGAGIEQICSEQGYTVLVASAPTVHREQEVIDTLVAQRVRAILLVPSGDDYAYLDRERHMGTGVVAIDRPAENLMADSVLLANWEGGYRATKALIEHGHRKIAFICNPASVFTQRERLKGYRQALREAGISRKPAHERLSDDPDETLDSMVASLLDSADPPTALFCGNNRASMAAIRELRRRGADLALIGFDDFDMADALNISVIAHDPVEMGRTAARLALKRLEKPTGRTESVILPVRYIPRGSAEKPPPA